MGKNKTARQARKMAMTTLPDGDALMAELAERRKKCAEFDMAKEDGIAPPWAIREFSRITRMRPYDLTTNKAGQITHNLNAEREQRINVLVGRLFDWLRDAGKLQNSIPIDDADPRDEPVAPAEDDK